MNVAPHVTQNTSGQRSTVADAIAKSEKLLIAAKERAHRAGLWLDQNGGMDSASNAARLETRGPDVGAGDGYVKLHTHARIGENPSAGAKMAEKGGRSDLAQQ